MLPPNLAFLVVEEASGASIELAPAAKQNNLRLRTPNGSAAPSRCRPVEAWCRSSSLTSCTPNGNAGLASAHGSLGHRISTWLTY